MRTLGLDPSSTRTGYALLTGLDPADLVDAGYLAPAKTRAPAVERVGDQCRALADLIAELAPDRIVIEIPSAEVAASRRRRAAGKGLAVYGFAAGAIWHAARVAAAELPGAPGADLPGVVTAVDERTWTGSQPKGRRTAAIAAIYPSYARAATAGDDTGGDAADAIGLARWGMRQGLGAGV